MPDQNTRRIIQYRMAMSIAKEMLDRGIISKEQYGIIDTIMLEKYGVSSCTIFRWF